MNTVHLTEEARAHLMALANPTGRLTPAIVVADAKSPESPLHELFDWTVTTAAERWWEHQARVLIRSIKVVITNEHIVIKTPFLVRDPGVPSKDQGYVSVLELQKDPAAAKQSILLEIGRAEGAMTRVRTLAVALGLSVEVEELISRMVDLRQQLAA